MAKNTVFHAGVNGFKNAPSPYAIEVLQSTAKTGLFTVIYGLQVKNDLTYSQACAEIGSVILHNACLEGLASNDGVY